jgi:5-formyltetrahydrofolate cyclo-ligase
MREEDETKDRLRRQVEAARGALDARDVAHRSAAMCARVLALPLYERVAHVVVYTAHGGEIDPAPVATLAAGAGKRVYYPAVDGCFRARSDASAAAFFAGTVEGEVLPEAVTDVLFLVPGVMFDSRGVRLGRGRGWYDRVLARHPQGTRIGLAYEFQVVPHLPEAPWDVRMHGVATEARMLGLEPARIGQ